MSTTRFIPDGGRDPPHSGQGGEQVTPSVWTAYRTHRPTGIARGTRLLILAELFCWGIYGVHESDLQLTVLGWTGVAASVLSSPGPGPRPERAVVAAAAVTGGRAAAPGRRARPMSCSVGWSGTSVRGGVRGGVSCPYPPFPGPAAAAGSTWRERRLVRRAH